MEIARASHKKYALKISEIEHISLIALKTIY